ncbi:glycosyltransferase family 4 protein [Synechococcus sp. CB0205]|jgi:glycosyltransferase involved in cell wall biosynthesis|uniref:glycosyltransferase family 4 protein n=1 Tax=Synechococcus sp. CB0205 TaxID=232363 RepID=UPI00020024BD|nr:glycosyltransferase family 4 protein [Synechococcus sp. CB0205]
MPALRKPKRLLLISEHFEPSTGATAQLMTDLAEGLHRRGWSVTVLTATPGGALNVPVQRLGGRSGVAIGVTAKVLRGARFLLGSLLWCLWHGRRGDGVLIVSNPPFIGILGPLLQLSRRLPYVFVFQDLFPRSAVLSGVLPAAGPVALVWRSLMQEVCRHSATTVVLSQAMEERLRRDLGRELPLEVIHNWAVERGLSGPRAQNAFAKEQGFEDRFTLQYSGNFGRLHDLLTLLEAARLLQDTRVMFVFIGGGAKGGQIEAYQQGFGLKNVLQLPYQPRQRLPESLSACDLSAIGLIPGAEDTVAPSKFYGILASGRGVVLIARRSCDLAQLVLREGCGIVVEPGEAAELAERLRALSEAPQEVAAMGERSRTLYERQFGVDRSIDRYAAILERLA